MANSDGNFEVDKKYYAASDAEFIQVGETGDRAGLRMRTCMRAHHDMDRPREETWGHDDACTSARCEGWRLRARRRSGHRTRERRSTGCGPARPPMDFYASARN